MPIQTAIHRQHICMPLLKVCLSNLPKNVAQNAPQNENKQTNFGTMGWRRRSSLRWSKECNVKGRLLDTPYIDMVLHKFGKFLAARTNKAPLLDH